MSKIYAEICPMYITAPSKFTQDMLFSASLQNVFIYTLRAFCFIFKQEQLKEIKSYSTMNSCFSLLIKWYRFLLRLACCFPFAFAKTYLMAFSNNKLLPILPITNFMSFFLYFKKARDFFILIHLLYKYFSILT